VDTPLVPQHEALAALDASYDALRTTVRALDDSGSWLPTACEGWSARDLVVHCLEDARRALVALHTPATQAPDRDGITYWKDWAPDPVGAANGRRFTRVVASMFLQWPQLQELFLETTAAVASAARGAAPDLCVATQGHRLYAHDLLRTLAVEATVHHLDLTAYAADAPPPSTLGLAEVRRTLDGLLGRPVPVDWDDEHYARAATGRLPLTEEERAALGSDADRIPLFS
jgi:hypothetical protein